MNIEAIAIYPWLELREPLSVCGMEFLPREIAIDRGGEIGPNIENATSYFSTGFMTAESMEGPRSPQMMEPTLVFLADKSQFSTLEIATHLLTFCSVINNSAGMYANATLFEHHFIHPTGGRAYARRTRRIHGNALNGAAMDCVIETRPAWCGQRWAHNKELLQALEAVIFDEKAKPIRESLRALMGALTDSDGIDPELEHSLFARAIERLLHQEGDTQKTRGDNQKERCFQLLNPLLTQEQRKRRYPHIMEVRHSVQSERNAFWHPEEKGKQLYAFEQQQAVHPNLLAFYMVAAFVIATRHECLPFDQKSRLIQYVPGIEAWIADIKVNDSRPSEEASNVREYISKRYFRAGFARCFGEASTKKAGPAFADTAP